MRSNASVPALLVNAAAKKSFDHHAKKVAQLTMEYERLIRDRIERQNSRKWWDFFQLDCEDMYGGPSDWIHFKLDGATANRDRAMGLLALSAVAGAGAITLSVSDAEFLASWMHGEAAS